MKQDSGVRGQDSGSRGVSPRSLDYEKAYHRMAARKAVWKTRYFCALTAAVALAVSTAGPGAIRALRASSERGTERRSSALRVPRSALDPRAAANRPARWLGRPHPAPRPRLRHHLQQRAVVLGDDRQPR